MFFTQADKDKLDLLALDLRKIKDSNEYNVTRLIQNVEFLDKKINNIIELIQELKTKSPIKKKKT